MRKITLSLLFTGLFIVSGCNSENTPKTEISLQEWSSLASKVEVVDYQKATVKWSYIDYEGNKTSDTTVYKKNETTHDWMVIQSNTRVPDTIDTDLRENAKTLNLEKYEEEYLSFFTFYDDLSYFISLDSTMDGNTNMKIECNKKYDKNDGTLRSAFYVTKASSSDNRVMTEKLDFTISYQQ